VGNNNLSHIGGHFQDVVGNGVVWQFARCPEEQHALAGRLDLVHESPLVAQDVRFGTACLPGSVAGIEFSSNSRPVSWMQWADARTDFGGTWPATNAEEQARPLRKYGPTVTVSQLHCFWDVLCIHSWMVAVGARPQKYARRTYFMQ
jgi:hypothetical protein